MYFFVQTKSRIEIQMFIANIYILAYKYLMVQFAEPSKNNVVWDSIEKQNNP